MLLLATRLRTLLGCAALTLLGLVLTSDQALAQWSEISVPQNPLYVYVGPGEYAAKKEFIRGGQQKIRFDAGSNIFTQMRVRVNGEAWETIYSGPGRTGWVEWANTPTAPGSYTVTLADPWQVYTFPLFVVPQAQRAFRHTEVVSGRRSTMLLWQGGSNSMDKPLLVVEGIDAENGNSPATYYALGSDPDAALFPRGQAEGADVLILDFADGGRDMRLNADVVRTAIAYVRTRRTDPSRGTDVVGVSMGGVVARYALAKMEEENETHGVARFVSMDAPQQGATFDGTFQGYVRANLPQSDWPTALTRVAGLQLLSYNLFDQSSPSYHDVFYQELGGLNGGTGYPQLTENIGVSFGTPDPNPNDGEEWLEVHEPPGPLNPNEHFYVGGAWAAPGSFLPRDLTDIWGVVSVAYVTLQYNLERHSDPTFIPFDSALDIGTNGQSAFDLPLIYPSVISAHDQVPEDIVSPLLNRLGYELPPPSSVWISGPSSLALQETGTFEAVVPDPGAGYQYNWEYRVYLPSCSGGGGGGEIGIMAVTCGQWHDGYGSGEIYTYSSQSSMWLHLRVTATSENGSVRSPIKYVCIGNCNGSRTAPVTSEDEALTAARDGVEAGAPVSTATAGGTAIPAAYSLGQNYPNPFGTKAGATQTTIRFSLPEASHARLVVYDALGREVAQLFDGNASAGMHEVTFDTAGLPGGVYLYRLTAGGHTEAQRMTVLN